MLKNEFLDMMHQDLETIDNVNAKHVLLCFEEILKDYPSTTDIDSSKTCEDCYQQMKEEARERATDGSYCFFGDSLKSFIIEYLGLEKIQNNQTSKVRLEDFF